MRRASAVLGVVAGLLVAAPMVAPVLAGQGWTFLASPSSIVIGVPTTVRLTVRNASSKGGSATSIGCVQVTAPANVSVRSVAVVSVTGGRTWRVSSPGGAGATITARAASDGDRLVGGSTTQSIVLGARVVGAALGSGAWTADVSSDTGCSPLSGHPLARPSKVMAKVTPTPTPTPTPRRTPAPTPAPTPRPTPAPAGSPTPTATATPSPTPTATPTATPRASPTASPTATASPRFSAPPTGGPTPASGGAAQSSAVPSPPVPGGPGTGPGPGFAVGAGPSGGSIGLVAGTLDLAGQFSAFLVPGLLLTTPGLLVLLAVALQLLGGAAWLPVVRRRLGDFGLRRRVTRGR